MTHVSVGLLMMSASAFAQPPGLGQGWLPEFNHAASQLVGLAEATPADQFGWRPAAGVRSISEVYMHIALGNYWLLDQAGVALPPGTPKLVPGLEKKITAKAEVIEWLKNSLEAIRQSYPKADLHKKVKFFGQEVPADSVFLRILVHNEEHMGQLIAYARMIDVVPPWSK
jgi:uncharacterized damage-inducible protein DinB